MICRHFIGSSQMDDNVYSMLLDHAFKECKIQDISALFSLYPRCRLWRQCQEWYEGGRAHRQWALDLFQPSFGWPMNRWFLTHQPPRSSNWSPHKQETAIVISPADVVICSDAASPKWSQVVPALFYAMNSLRARLVFMCLIPINLRNCKLRCDWTESFAIKCTVRDSVYAWQDQCLLHLLDNQSSRVVCNRVNTSAFGSEHMQPQSQFLRFSETNSRHGSVDHWKSLHFRKPLFCG